ncbi:MAG TPA: hypothetical protein VLG14_10940, partial [Sphingomonas sp.]|nr:hypothetical protein [Sphingomonas sp.]
QLKFDGDTVRKLNGAPAEAVIASLNALQRIVLILGMRAEGRALGQRLKATAKVKREYAVVCRAPEHGSHIQPFNVASQSGQFTPAAAAARERLLTALKAFDSGDDDAIRRALPNARERWFVADAALGLVPDEHAGVQVTIRPGAHGPFSFKADRAKPHLMKYRKGTPPNPEEEEVAGKLITIDYNRTIITVKPGRDHAVRIDYPLKLESWAQANVRKRLRIVGEPSVNARGDITGFQEVYSISEIEPSLPPIDRFEVDGNRVATNRPLHMPVTFDYEDRLFIFQDSALGIDVFAEQYEDLRSSVLSELSDLWRVYAEAEDRELAPDALEVKRHLRARFRVSA